MNGNGNGNGRHPSVQQLVGARSEKQYESRHFPVTSLEDVLREIHRSAGTGKLEIHFCNGKARGGAKWEGYSRP